MNKKNKKDKHYAEFISHIFCENIELKALTKDDISKIHAIIESLGMTLKKEYSYAQILILYFGLGCKQHTLKDIGKKIGCGSSVANYRDAAIRMLRHPKRSRLLRNFFKDYRPDTTTVADLGKIGLSSIFEGLNYKTIIDKNSGGRIRYKQHPLGLDFKYVENPMAKNMGIIGVANPNHTDESVSSMIAHIRWLIAENPIENIQIEYLRIVYIEDVEGDIYKHVVYYEISCSYGIFICGGCTDYSGAGKEGKKTLDGVFTLLSMIYQVSIEKIDMDYQQGQDIKLLKINKETE